MPKTYSFADETFTLESAGPGRSWVMPSDPGPDALYGVIGVNVHGTDRNPFCWSMDAGDSIPSGMIQGNISGTTFEHNLQALCSRLIEAQAFSQERSAFDRQRAMEEMSQFTGERIQK